MVCSQSSTDGPVGSLAVNGSLTTWAAENTTREASFAIEVGAIGVDDNATFTEEDEFCVNDTDPDGTYDEEEDAVLNGCGFEVDDEDDD